MTGLSPAAVRKGFERARERRQPWEPLWRECYAYALPQRGIGLGAEFAPARRYSDGLFDGTAADAVEQLAASLLAELTPPWSQWFGFRPGHDVGADERVGARRLSRGRGRPRARPFRALDLRGRDPPVLPRSGDRRHGHAPVPGSAGGRAVGVSVLRGACRRDVHRRRPERPDPPALPGDQPDPGRRSAAAIPDARLARLADRGRRAPTPSAGIEVLEAVLQQGAGYAYIALLRHPRAMAPRTACSRRAASSSRHS